MTALRYHAHQVCLITRAYPTATFWLLMCATLAAGIDGNVVVLALLVGAQFCILAHMVRRMWSPQVLIALTRVPMSTKPDPDSPERRHHRRDQK